jgi:hypothetical protein
MAWHLLISLLFKTASTTFQKGAAGYEELSTSAGLWEELLCHYVRVTLPCESKKSDIFSHHLYLKMEADPFLNWRDFHTYHRVQSSND